MPTLESLPVLAPVSSLRLRTPAQVASRCICSALIADIALGHDPDLLIDLLNSSGLARELSPVERQFIGHYSNDATGRRKLAWRHESAFVLLWALGQVDALPAPTEEVQLDEIYRCLPNPADFPGTFINGSCLRPKEQILDQLDQVYRMHWASKRDQSSICNQDVLMERHHALSWLTCYGGLDWDDVSTDT